MKKPPSLIYSVDEVPPHPVTVLNALQHAALVGANLVYPLLVFRTASLDTELVANLLSIGFFVLGIGTVMQAWPRMGSGFLCPTVFTATFIGPALAAVKLGGIPLLFGMTLFSGVIQSLLSRVLNLLRPILPTELSGFVVLMVGITAGVAGLRTLVGPGGTAGASATEWAIAIGSLGVMVGLSTWAGGLLKMICMLVGIAAGYVAAWFTGVLDPDFFGRVWNAPLLSFPSFSHMGWSFDVAMAVPFAVAGVATTLKAMGTITLAHRTNDADWVRPDPVANRKGVLADGLTIMLAGIAGSYGTNTGSSNVALVPATGVASRRVAYATAAFLAALGLFPMLAMVLALMPRPVMAAALIFSTCFLLVNGMQIITSRMLDTRKTLVIGLGLLAGFIVEVFPAALSGVPKSFAPITGSSLVLGTITALSLNLLFRLGIRQTVRLTIEPGQDSATAIENFFRRHGAAWGARPEIVSRATFGTLQLVETVAGHCEPKGTLRVEASFDEFSLDVRLYYEGLEIEFPERRPTNEEIREGEDGMRRLAGFMLRRNADRISAKAASDRITVHFHFDH